MANENKKDIANSLNKYTEYAHKGTNLLLDSADNINKWYEQKINEITESDINTSRIETNVDNKKEMDLEIETNEEQIETKINKYNRIQTGKNININKNVSNQKIQTAINDDIEGNNIEENNRQKSTGRQGHYPRNHYISQYVKV